MKINAIIATIVTFGLSFAIAAEPETVADTDSKNVDWWVQRTHPASIKEIPKERGWTHLEHNGLKIAVLIGMSWTGGESNIPVSAYLYNQSFKVWRQFMTLHTRNAYDLQAAIDGKRNVLEIVGGRHSPHEGTIIASYSLEAVSDDRAYVEIESETEQDGARQPATASESKSGGNEKPKLESEGRSLSVATAQNSKDAKRALSTDPQMFRLAAFANSEKLDWAPLKVGVNIHAKSDRYQWNVVPESLGGVRFLVLPAHAGVLNFEVQSGGIVYIATSTRWYDSGNSSGDWKDEVLLEKDLRRKGWRRLRAFNKLSNTDTGEMAVFYRHCEAGEKHSIRTEKYAAPMLLVR